MPKIPKPTRGYKYFCQVEPQESLGPIYTEKDDVFGKEVRVRDVKIGMVRNAKEENKKPVKVYIDPYPHTRVEKAKPLQGWYKGANEPNQVRPRPCYTEALLTSPYMGFCPNNCAFCYINSGIRGYRATGLTVVPTDYGTQIAKQLSGMCRAAAGYFTSFHDPFNLLEKYYHNSQEGAQAFVDVGLPIFFLSRLKYPEWALDLLSESHYSYAQKSINTPSPDDWRKLSPGALSLKGHLQDLKRISDRGIYTSIQVNPIIPGVTTNQQIVELFQLLADAGANHVIVKFIESSYSWATAMVAKMTELFGERGLTFAKLFNQNIGGERTVEEEYRIKAHELYRKTATKLGMTYSLCYEYSWERDKKGEVVSKTGISLGPRFMTSDQCHGQRVPMFTRSTNKESFREVIECPPSGCLYCSEGNGGEPRCGDVVMGEAWALRTANYRKPL